MTQTPSQPWAVGRGMWHGNQEVVGLFFVQPMTGLPDGSLAGTKPVLMAIHANGGTAAVTDDLRLTGDKPRPQPVEPPRSPDYQDLAHRAAMQLSPDEYAAWLERPDIEVKREAWMKQAGAVRVPADVNLDGTASRRQGWNRGELDPEPNA